MQSQQQAAKVTTLLWVVQKGATQYSRDPPPPDSDCVRDKEGHSSGAKFKPSFSLSLSPSLPPLAAFFWNCVSISSIRKSVKQHHGSDGRTEGGGRRRRRRRKQKKYPADADVLFGIRNYSRWRWRRRRRKDKHNIRRVSLCILTKQFQLPLLLFFFFFFFFCCCWRGKINSTDGTAGQGSSSSGSQCLLLLLLLDDVSLTYYCSTAAVAAVHNNLQLFIVTWTTCIVPYRTVLGTSVYRHSCSVSR